MTLEQKLGEALKDRRDEVAELCSCLINIPTPNPPGEGYQELVDFLCRWFAKERIGYEVIRIEENELSNLLPTQCHGPRIFFMASLEGKAKGPTLYLQGHYDTIPPVGGWTKPPYSAESDGQKIWGLGASDMKGGLASMMMAMKAMAAVGGPPKGRIVFLATPDEEFASRANITYLFSKEKIAGDFAIVGEFSGIDNVFVGMKGGIWGDLKVKGKAAHASQARKGINAFEKLARVTVQVEQRFQPCLLAKKSSYRFIPPEYDSPSVMIGGILQGSNNARSAVPDMASASFDLRTIPEDRDHALVNDFRDFLTSLKSEISDLEFELEVASQFPTYALAEDSPLVQALQRVVPQVIGKPISLSVSCAATEAAFFNQKGIAAIAYGPGIWWTAHAKDEYVFVDDLERAALVYAQVAARIAQTT